MKNIPSAQKEDISVVLKETYDIEGNIDSIEELSWWVINLTYKVVIWEVSYVVQQITSPNWRTRRDMNRFFAAQDELKKRASDILMPTVIKDISGEIVPEFNGKRWHVQEYIQNDITDTLNPETAYSAWKLVWKLRRDLLDWEPAPKDLWEFAWDTYMEVYKSTLIQTIDKYKDHPFRWEVESWMAELNETIWFCETLEFVRQPWIIHGDTKLANILFRDGKAIGFVDPDGFEYTYAIWEVWQMIRSFAGKAEDGKKYDPDLVRAALSWYNSTLPKENQFTLKQGITSAIYQSVNLLFRVATDVLEEKLFRWDEKKYKRAAEDHVQGFFWHRNMYRELVADIRSID